MKIKDGISSQLTAIGYRRLDIHLKSLELYFRPLEAGAEIILFLRAFTGKEMTREEYRRILDNIRQKFTDSGFQTINLLGLIFTLNPDIARRFCLEEDDHWIVDLSERRLMVYENQSPYFLGLKAPLENIIEDESYETGLVHGRSSEDEWEICTESTHKVEWITLLNTILIAANILVFLVVQHTRVFGDTAIALKAGALSWYFVKEENQYYRILTSMFLHTNLEHLLNNMLVLFFVGDNLERAAGKIKYMIIYLGSGIIAGISSISYNMLKEEAILSVGASGAIFGIVGAMAYILFINKGRLEDINSRQIILFTVFSLYGGIANAHIDNAAHIGGFIGGVILALLLYRRPGRKAVIHSAAQMDQGGQEER